MSGRSRKLTTLEQKLHQAVLSANEADKRLITRRVFYEQGLLRIRTDAKGAISYRAVGKKEVEAGEEVLVLNHIQAAANEGIRSVWLCLKSLVQKQLIKSIKNVKVKYPTRKIYMLFHLEPSSTITGGPWYTDNELDTEFIKLLTSACLKFIREKSFPKTKYESQPLFPSLPQQLQNFLQKSRITETQLSVEHVEMLLNVLITDGEIERLPAFGAALWEANSREDEEDSDEENKRRKRRKKDSSEQRDNKRRRKASRADNSDSQLSSDDVESGSESDKSADERDSEYQILTHFLEMDNRHDVGHMVVDSDDYGGAYVYRAIRQERVALGWSQAPCGRCPQFEFCKDGGPVNPRECEYYGDWLNQVEVAPE
ncbi:RNA polymerase Rpc34 [Phellopilus nigrolimitatus]|nr:RNA polymerase Rpc34 [Phellopilus nigrolimitatus]